MPLDLSRLFRREPKKSWELALEARRALGQIGPAKPRVYTRAILMNEMADNIVKRVFGKKGKALTREQMLQTIDDNMLLAAMVLSERLAEKDQDEEERFNLGDTLQMFKQLREYQNSQARIGKIDPSKDKGRDSTPSGIEGYQQALKDAQAAAPAEPAKPRVTKDGKPDKRHDNDGRPPGLSLAKQQEQIRKAQARMVVKELKAAEKADAEAEANKPREPMIGEASEPEEDKET